MNHHCHLVQLLGVLQHEDVGAAVLQLVLHGRGAAGGVDAARQPARHHRRDVRDVPLGGVVTWRTVV